ncbi:MAG TPA: chloride channel protein [Vicinamibacterales bacterium]|nr:chloride channel protein [Vicinamibacterales bacterium]HPW19459.1 chloride channel protein [Vicinamibacterales bacterium]
MTSRPSLTAPSEPARGGFRSRLASWADDDALRRHEEKAFFVLTLVIGAIVGLVIVAFILLTENLGARLFAPDAASWHRLVIPVLGALVSGVLLARVFQGARGSGIPQTKVALYLEDGLIHLRTVLGKFACSSLSLASGIALGREGPSVHIGAGIASVIGRRLGLSSSHTKRLVPVGAAAAVAAAFNTPVAAVLFTLEEVVEDLHAPVVGSIVLSSATAWMVLRLLLGDEPLFHVPAYELVHPIEFVVYAALGVAGGIVSVAFVKLLLAQRRWFRGLPASTVWFQPVIGGIVTGLIGWAVPAVLGVGYAHVGEALNGKMALGVMALLLGLKLVATAAGYASGNAGGIFGPSLFLGAMMGGSIGGLVHTWFPDYTGGVGAYALVGMGAAFAGIIRAPFTSVVMIFEITRNYAVIVPLMIANLVSYFISSRLQREPIYEALLHQDGVRLPRRRAEREDQLAVGLAMRPARAFVPAGESAAAAAARLGVPAGATEAAPAGAGEAGIADPWRRGWPIMDGDSFVGWLGAADLRRALRDGLHDAPARGLAAAVSPPDPSAPSRSLHPDDTLDLALRRMGEAGLDELPVVSRTRPDELLGTVSVTDVVGAYRKGGGDPQPEATPGRNSPRTLLIRLAVVVLIVLIGSGTLGHRLRTARLEGAARAFETGRALAAQGREPEAIEQFRRALAVSGSADVRLELARTLLAVDRPAEAALYFGEMLRADPASGEANLGLARAAGKQGRTGEAILAYSRALVGNWTGRPEQRRIEAGFEFADYLARSGMRDQAVAQLLDLQQAVSGNPGLLLDVGRRFLSLGADAQSASLFRAVITLDPARIDALLGLGEAELAQDNFEAARDAFRRAEQIDPGNATAASRRRLLTEVLSLNPEQRRLSSGERHRRSLALLSAALAQFDACAKASGAAGALAPAGPLAEAARRTLARRARPASLADAAEENVDVAQQLWSARERQCPASGEPTAVGVLMKHLAR